MEHAPRNAMVEPGEIERFRDRCSERLGALLDELATTPDASADVDRALIAGGGKRRRLSQRFSRRCRT